MVAGDIIAGVVSDELGKCSFSGKTINSVHHDGPHREGNFHVYCLHTKVLELG